MPTHMMESEWMEEREQIIALYNEGVGSWGGRLVSFDYETMGTHDIGTMLATIKNIASLMPRICALHQRAVKMDQLDGELDLNDYIVEIERTIAEAELELFGLESRIATWVSTPQQPVTVRELIELEKVGMEQIDNAEERWYVKREIMEAVAI